MFGIEQHAKKSLKAQNQKSLKTQNQKSLKTQNQEGVEKQDGNGGAIQDRKFADVVAAANLSPCTPPLEPVRCSVVRILCTDSCTKSVCQRSCSCTLHQ
jgi:hypothetical protein